MQHAWDNFSIVVRKLLKISSHPHEITYYFGNCSKGKKLQKVHMQTRVPAPTFPHSWFIYSLGLRPREQKINSWWKTDAGNSWHNLLFWPFAMDPHIFNILLNIFRRLVSIFHPCCEWLLDELQIYFSSFVYSLTGDVQLCFKLYSGQFVSIKKFSYATHELQWSSHLGHSLDTCEPRHAKRKLTLTHLIQLLLELKHCTCNK